MRVSRECAKLAQATDTAIIAQATAVLQSEAEAILAMATRLDHPFVEAIRLLLACRGRTVVTGMGKSGLIGRKIAATLASTGTPALFLHPAEGSHGDIGMLAAQDVVLALSNSGETWELLTLLPSIKRLGVPLISLVGRIHSTLARMSDVVLDVTVNSEACPMGLAPTRSTTAALAMGDALAMVLLQQRGFNREQFALLHPGGHLGRRLLLHVSDLMLCGDAIPLVQGTDSVQQALWQMTSKHLGMTGVLDESQRLVGIITDGDIRRHLENDNALLCRSSSAIMTTNPKKIAGDALAVDALRRMETHKITCLFVVDDVETVTGVIHLHTLLSAGLSDQDVPE
ncbi:MAG: KpsF/GutQ family sugar-phosphate isomerase [Magnetococcales bacterium]|nr:KpsF/GutQ family sugar-phosphate isomerase [Magnetococcales bacterium]